MGGCSERAAMKPSGSAKVTLHNDGRWPLPACRMGARVSMAFAGYDGATTRCVIVVGSLMRPDFAPQPEASRVKRVSRIGNAGRMSLPGDLCSLHTARVCLRFVCSGELETADDRCRRASPSVIANVRTGPCNPTGALSAWSLTVACGIGPNLREVTKPRRSRLKSKHRESANV
jgi:hypothetical protein